MALLGSLLFLASAAGAAPLFVDVNNPTPASPYTNWATAANNIQDAVDASMPGDEILVTNGVYETGARAVWGMSNRVAVTKPLTVRSVNGPAVTQIRGYQAPGTINGAAAVRCVYLTNGAVLAGFTLTNGATQTSGDLRTNQSGGGVWCEGLSAVVSNCVLTCNSASSAGGGAYESTLNNCSLMGNYAQYGGGAYESTLSNCTLTGNSASVGGGAYDCTLDNCALTGNSAGYGGGAYESTLDNCALTGNAASSWGGGAHSGTLNHCTLTDNSANSGGGAYESTLNNCALTGNSAASGGGACYSTLNNCTLTGNSAVDSGGGAYAGTLNNCIVYYNSAPFSGTNYGGGTLMNYCCTTPLPAGPGNLVEEPQLASATHLSAGSLCRGRGSAAYARGVDLDGEPWANPPSIGCDEYWSGSVTGAPSVAIVAAYTNLLMGFGVDFQGVIGGRVNASRWDFGDGVVVSNRPWASHAWAAVGDYVVELRAYNESYPAGVAATVTVHVVQEEHFVALTSTNPVPPYSSWATAATNIQDAVDAAVLPGARVWVSNGVYQTGARALWGMSNRVAVAKVMTVQSVNGPAVTQIVGYQMPRTRYGPAAVRCVYLTNGAVLVGFTLTNGATRTSGDYGRSQCGGAVWCEGLSAVVSNCVLTGNSAYWDGGGTYNGTLNNCTLTSNSTSSLRGGGAHLGTLNNCTLTGNSARYGGGASLGTLNNCTLKGNSAVYEGGGAYGSTLSNCTLTSNSAGREGGGASYGTLNNCTLTGNSASAGGGASRGTLNNCIVYYNSAGDGTNYYNYYVSTLNYCCTTPLPPGVGNFTTGPLFMDTNDWSDLRLQTSSPCVNAGNNVDAIGDTDLAGHPRIVGATVDVGAYELQYPVSITYHAWLQQYGLPTDGSADATDPDQDRLNNWQEWQADTDPTNALSVLRITTISASLPVTVQFLSSSNRLYTLLYATNLSAAPWTNVPGQTDVPGTGGGQTLSDTNATPPRFYRVCARLP